MASASSSNATGKILKRANPQTIQDKFLVGYQGWFTCAGDGEPVGPGHHGWLHWFNYPIPDGGRPNTDLWPDVSAYSPSELYPAPGLKSKSGEQLFLFSSRNAKTVQRHFHWMAEHGVDGVFLQRFAGQCDLESGNQGIMKIRDEVGDRVMEAAEREGRVFAIMYDVSGVDASRLLDILQRDWQHLVRTKGVLDSPNYLHERGKPVIALWGLGFTESRHPPGLVRAIVSFFRTCTPGGAYIMLGAPSCWRTGGGDADQGNEIANKEMLDVFLSEFDAISPWTIGRYRTELEADQFYESKMKGDSELIKKKNEETGRKVDYIPVVLPGGSGFNLSEGKWAFNDIKRRGGRFLWQQIANAKRLGVRTIYGAMWDEYDEGTAFMPCIEHKHKLPHSDKFKFLALDEDGFDVPPDWYMRICGFAAEGLRGERRIQDTFPSKELQDYWSSRPKYENVPSKSMDFVSGSSSSGAAESQGSSSGTSGSVEDGGQTYQEWLESQKEKKEEAPPPPYTLEAEEAAASAPAPATTAPLTSIATAATLTAPTSTESRPASNHTSPAIAPQTILTHSQPTSSSTHPSVGPYTPGSHANNAATYPPGGLYPAAGPGSGSASPHAAYAASPHSMHSQHSAMNSPHSGSGNGGPPIGFQQQQQPYLQHVAQQVQRHDSISGVGGLTTDFGRLSTGGVATPSGPAGGLGRISTTPQGPAPPPVHPAHPNAQLTGGYGRPSISRPTSSNGSGISRPQSGQGHHPQYPNQHASQPAPNYPPQSGYPGPAAGYNVTSPTSTTVETPGQWPPTEWGVAGGSNAMAALPPSTGGANLTRPQTFSAGSSYGHSHGGANLSRPGSLMGTAPSAHRPAQMGSQVSNIPPLASSSYQPHGYGHHHTSSQGSISYAPPTSVTAAHSVPNSPYPGGPTSNPSHPGQYSSYPGQQSNQAPPISSYPGQSLNAATSTTSPSSTYPGQHAPNTYSWSPHSGQAPPSLPQGSPPQSPPPGAAGSGFPPDPSVYKPSYVSPAGASSYPGGPAPYFPGTAGPPSTTAPFSFPHFGGPNGGTGPGFYGGGGPGPGGANMPLAPGQTGPPSNSNPATSTPYPPSASYASNNASSYSGSAYPGGPSMPGAESPTGQPPWMSSAGPPGPGGFAAPPPAIPPRPPNHSSYSSYNRPSSSGAGPGPSFPMASSTFNYGLSTVEKFAGKKTKDQLESGLGSLAQSGSKLYSKFMK